MHPPLLIDAFSDKAIYATPSPVSLQVFRKYRDLYTRFGAALPRHAVAETGQPRGADDAAPGADDDDSAAPAVAARSSDPRCDATADGARRVAAARGHPSSASPRRSSPCSPDRRLSPSSAAAAVHGGKGDSRGQVSWRSLRVPLAIRRGSRSAPSGRPRVEAGPRPLLVAGTRRKFGSEARLRSPSTGYVERVPEDGGRREDAHERRRDVERADDVDSRSASDESDRPDGERPHPVSPRGSWPSPDASWLSKAGATGDLNSTLLDLSSCSSSSTSGFASYAKSRDSPQGPSRLSADDDALEVADWPGQLPSESPIVERRRRRQERRMLRRGRRDTTTHDRVGVGENAVDTERMTEVSARATIRTDSPDISDDDDIWRSSPVAERAHWPAARLRRPVTSDAFVASPDSGWRSRASDEAVWPGTSVGTGDRLRSRGRRDDGAAPVLSGESVAGERRAAPTDFCACVEALQVLRPMASCLYCYQTVLHKEWCQHWTPEPGYAECLNCGGAVRLVVEQMFADLRRQAGVAGADDAPTGTGDEEATYSTSAEVREREASDEQSDGKNLGDRKLTERASADSGPPMPVLSHVAALTDGVSSARSGDDGGGYGEVYGETVANETGRPRAATRRRVDDDDDQTAQQMMTQALAGDVRPEADDSRGGVGSLLRRPQQPNPSSKASSTSRAALEAAVAAAAAAAASDMRARWPGPTDYSLLPIMTTRSYTFTYFESAPRRPGGTPSTLPNVASKRRPALRRRKT